jgi:NADH:ubiquinone oxidoreductase subunit 6 (subunit J)
MFSDSSTQVPPTTVDFAVSILNDWAIITIVLGILLAMAMIGASYLVRDERLVNLLYDMGGEER